MTITICQQSNVLQYQRICLFGAKRGSSQIAGRVVCHKTSQDSLVNMSNVKGPEHAEATACTMCTVLK